MSSRCYNGDIAIRDRGVGRPGDTGAAMGLAWYGKRSRRIAALAAALAALGWAGGAGAAISSCDGTYSATLLHKLPTPMVVGLYLIKLKR